MERTLVWVDVQVTFTPESTFTFTTYESDGRHLTQDYAEHLAFLISKGLKESDDEQDQGDDTKTVSFGHFDYSDDIVVRARGEVLESDSWAALASKGLRAVIRSAVAEYAKTDVP